MISYILLFIMPPKAQKRQTAARQTTSNRAVARAQEKPTRQTAVSRPGPNYPKVSEKLKEATREYFTQTTVTTVRIEEFKLKGDEIFNTRVNQIFGNLQIPTDHKWSKDPTPDSSPLSDRQVSITTTTTITM